MDLLAYTIKMDSRAGLVQFPPKLKRIMDKTMQRDGIVIRKIDVKHLDEEIARVIPVYDGAWAKNWGFVPMTKAEFQDLAHGMKDVLDPDLLYVVEANGEPIGVSLTLPDLCDPLLRAYPKPGTPEVWSLAKFLYYYKVGKTQKYIRVLIMGVLPQYRLSGIDALLMAKTADAAMNES